VEQRSEEDEEKDGVGEGRSETGVVVACSAPGGDTVLVKELGSAGFQKRGSWMSRVPLGIRQRATATAQGETKGTGSVTHVVSLSSLRRPQDLADYTQTSESLLNVLDTWVLVRAEISIHSPFIVFFM